jgi:UDP-N-acetylglucosamine 2-epimerase (hydrolysing)
MKYASFIAGNSSAGIREAPYYGIPTLNIGTRQNGRTNNDDIIHTDYRLSSVLEGLQEALNKKILPKHLFGEGKSDEKFLAVLESKDFWSISKQKLFDEQISKRKEEAFV